jgi:hypothetical protein
VARLERRLVCQRHRAVGRWRTGDRNLVSRQFAADHSFENPHRLTLAFLLSRSLLRS